MTGNEGGEEERGRGEGERRVRGQRSSGSEAERFEVSGVEAVSCWKVLRLHKCWLVLTPL